MFLIQPAYANVGSIGSNFDLMAFVPIVVIFVLFWFLMVRPQQKRMKEHQRMLSEIQKGDEVTTQGGIVGKVVKTSEQFLTLEIADNVQVQVQRGAVSAKLEKGTIKSI